MSATETPKKKAILVMIAYKTVSTLEEFYKTLPKHLFNEIILVDNDSGDGTYELAKKLGISAYRNEKNLGYGGNMIRALSIALDHGADIIVDIHPDGEYRATSIPIAIEEIRRGSHFVLGNRFDRSKGLRPQGMFVWKIPVIFVLNWITRKILGVRVHDLHQGFRVYDRVVLDSIDFRKNSTDYLFSFEIIVQAIEKGFRLSEVPVETVYTGKKRGASFKSSFVYTLGAIKVMLRFMLK